VRRLHHRPLLRPDRRNLRNQTDVHGAYAWTRSRTLVLLPTSAAMPEADRVQNGVNAGAYAVAVAPSDPQRSTSPSRGGSTVRRSGQELRPDGRLVHTVHLDANDANRHSGPFLSVPPFNPSVVLLGTPGEGLWPRRMLDETLSRCLVPAVPGRHHHALGAGRRPAHRTAVGDQRRQRCLRLERWRDHLRCDGGFADRPNTGDFAPNGDFYGITTDDRLVWKRARPLRNGPTSSTRAQCRPPLDGGGVNPAPARLLVDEGGASSARPTREAPLPGWAVGTEWAGGEPRCCLSPRARATFASGRSTSIRRWSPLWADTGTRLVRRRRALSPRLTWRSRTRGIEELVASDVRPAAGRDPLFSAFDFGIPQAD
jgi:hypothetical protein